MLHRYSFNDGTAGDSCATAGSALAGTIVGSATVSGGVLNVPSQGPYVSLPAGTFGSYTSISIELWATPGSSLGGWARIFQLGSSVSNTGSLVLDRNSNTGKVYMEYFPASTSIPVTTTVDFNGQYLHVAIVLAVGAKPILYVNGVSQGVAEYTMTAMLTPNYFRVGGSLDGGNSFQGTINEFRIWAGALSAAAIASHYQQGPGE